MSRKNNRPAQQMEDASRTAHEFVVQARRSLEELGLEDFAEGNTELLAAMVNAAAIAEFSNVLRDVAGRVESLTEYVCGRLDANAATANDAAEAIATELARFPSALEAQGVQAQHGLRLVAAALLRLRGNGETAGDQ
ncbi:MAG: hypothetical protein RIK00_05500 [Algiphilus sp.]|uniref:hypothetical protein n=1 Tax=Algiphilus sp. TaxID=1872431 RepID=UPI0032EADD83